jgi:GGDEF domain-containing protein
LRICASLRSDKNGRALPEPTFKVQLCGNELEVEVSMPTMPKPRDQKNQLQQIMGSWMDVASSPSNALDLSSLLVDQVTNLPTVPLLFEEMRKILHDRGQIGLLCISIVQNSMIEYIYGWKTYDAIIREVAGCLLDVKEDYLRKQDVVGEVTINGNALILLFSPPRTKEWIDYDDLRRLRGRIYEKLDSYLRERLDFNLYEKFCFYVGCAILEDGNTARFERNVYRALEVAYSDSLAEKTRESRRRTEILMEIVRKKMISTLYQPIVDLCKKDIIGYEALSRGLVCEYENPDFLFKLASEIDSIWRLERVCRAQAFRGASTIGW